MQAGMQTVRSVDSSVPHGFDSSSPLRQRVELASALGVAPVSGFQPVKPRPGQLRQLKRGASLAGNLQPAWASPIGRSLPEPAATLEDDQRWRLSQDLYTQDDDNAGWF